MCTHSAPDSRADPDRHPHARGRPRAQQLISSEDSQDLGAENAPIGSAAAALDWDDDFVTERDDLVASGPPRQPLLPSSTHGTSSENMPTKSAAAALDWDDDFFAELDDLVASSPPRRPLLPSSAMNSPSRPPTSRRGEHVMCRCFITI